MPVGSAIHVMLLLWGNHSLVHLIHIRVTRGVLLIPRRDVGPQLLRMLAPAIPDVKGHDGGRLRVHREPDSLPVSLLSDEAPQLFCFGFKPRYRHIMEYAIGWICTWPGKVTQQSTRNPNKR